tara:strand:- start:9363 stop:9989 length:627 start_codon:yes stop_codon:yes gene_type:complete
MTSTRKNLWVLAAVIVPAAVVSVIYLQLMGYRTETLDVTLRVTARLSCLIFIVVFAARPLRQLFNTGWSKWLARERRSLGLAFAGMHTVHLGLIFYGMATQTLGVALNPVLLLIGGTAYALMYLMVITSFDAPTKAIGPKAWKLLHKTGLYYNGFLFLGMLPPGSDEQLLNPGRMGLIILMSLAISARVAAFFKTRAAKRRRQTAAVA